MAKFNLEDFLKKAKLMHGNKYDYSKSIYKNNRTKLIINCPIHGDFLQLPFLHMQGSGCRKCSDLKRSNNAKMSHEDFINKAKEIHGDKYDYSETIYKSADENVIIICPKHGKFEQKRAKHIYLRRGCPECAVIKSAKKRSLSTKLFINKAKEIHGDKYDYSLVNYVNAHKKVDIICAEHGVFSQQPSNHLFGWGCNTCGHFLTGASKRHDQNDFIEKCKKIHGVKYDYSKTEYKLDRIKVIITCPIHGDFEQVPNAHLRGSGCPRCVNKAEGEVAEILNELFVVHRNYNIENKLFDFFLPEKNLIIERDGEQHYPKIWEKDSIFSMSGKRNYVLEHQNDIYKVELAKAENIKVCRIPYWLDLDEVKKEIENILEFRPSYPEIPDPEDEKSLRKPN